MAPLPRIAVAATAAGVALLAGCSAMRSQFKEVPRLRVEQGSFRMTKAIDASGSISLAETTQLLGRIDAGPILAAEGQATSTAQVIFHEGRYFIIADGFHNLWQVTPEPGTVWAAYRPIPLPDLPARNVRMSRYGPPDRACLRLDVDEGGPWYVTSAGGLRDECP